MLRELIDSLPPGTLILVVGGPGTGKTTLCTQYLLWDVERGNAVIYASFVEDEASFRRHMEDLGMRLDARLFTFIGLPTPTGPEGVNEVLAFLLSAIEDVKPTRIVLDPVNVVLELLGSREGRSLLHAMLINALRAMGISACMIYEERDSPDYSWYVADAVIRLRMEKERYLVRRVMELVKVRDRPTPLAEVEYVIGRGGLQELLGIEREIVGAVNFGDVMSTGVEGLDEVLGGGIPRSSSMIVSGQSGSGKTVLLLSIARGLAGRGERVAFISMEESTQQLMHIYRRLFSEAPSPNIHIRSTSPEVPTASTLYDILAKYGDDVRPSVYILDGVDAIVRTLGDESYRLVRALIRRAKGDGITAIMSTLRNVFREPILFSTLSDIIINLWIEFEGTAFRRRLAVVKARGMNHSTRVHELVIGPGGARVVL